MASHPARDVPGVTKNKRFSSERQLLFQKEVDRLPGITPMHLNIPAAGLYL